MRSTILVIVAAFISGVIIPTLFLNKCQNNKVKQIQQMSVVKLDSGRYWKDMYATEHFEKLQVIGNSTTIGIFYKQKIDSLAKLQKVKPKQISGFQETTAQLSGSVTVTTTATSDSSGDRVVTGSSFSWVDSFTSISGFVSSPDSSGHGIAKINYSSKLKLTSVTKWKRKHQLLGIHFGKKIYFIDVSADNPNIHITGLENAQINR